MIATNQLNEVASSQHIFALYVPNFWQGTELADTTKEIHQNEILHRLIKVLRSSLHDKFVFFDKAHHGLVELVQISKKDITIRILSFQANVVPQQKIVFLLPLLKKEALEEAVYSLSEIGVGTIQLVVTQKSRQKLLHEKEFERLRNIVIAAAEQSKNYMYPDLYLPEKLPDVLMTLDPSSSRIVFDAEGKSFFDLRLQASQASTLSVLVGPEGGLTIDEFDQVKKASFQSCRLTTTILRAVQATAVGAALFKLSQK